MSNLQIVQSFSGLVVPPATPSVVGEADDEYEDGRDNVSDRWSLAVHVVDGKSIIEQIVRICILRNCLWCCSHFPQARFGRKGLEQKRGIIRG